LTLSSAGTLTKWNVTGGSASLTGTIILSNAGVTPQTFAGGGLQYNDVRVTGAGAYTLTVTGNNSFNVFTVDASAAAKGITATGTTQRVTQFRRDGGTKVITLTGGTWIKTGSGSVSLDYLNITGSTAQPATLTWYAGSHSTDGGGNPGWLFGIPPAKTKGNVRKIPIAWY
jgi:hypothetical protein